MGKVRETLTDAKRLFFNRGNKRLLLLVISAACAICILEHVTYNGPIFAVFVETKEDQNASMIELWRGMRAETNEFLFNWKAHRVRMDENDYNLSMAILKALTDTLDKNDLTYFVYGGTLIGSVRHHGPIPWDDDIDLMVNYNQRDKIRKALKTLEPDYKLYSPEDQNFWKLFSKNSRETGNEYAASKWQYPFVDLWLYKEIDDYLLDWSWAVHGFQIKLPLKYTFPLQKRPFGNLELYAPCDPISILNAMYSWQTCASAVWSHKTESLDFRYARPVPCAKLTDYFPFVVRYETNTMRIENLLYKGKTIQTKILPKIC